jgi:glucosamine--fructose-6-phosphate aminotransferase (isomerizing)
MCGIVGYSGTGDAVSVLLDGLGRLEYRGYDSAGIACVRSGNLWRLRKAGRVADLVGAVLPDGKSSAPIEGSSGGEIAAGIAHTRWATHGAPTERNAHPHLDCSGRVAVIHNGILDNHRELRASLAAGGHKMQSDTDSELLAHLIEDSLRSGKSLVEAALDVLRVARGAVAMAAISADHQGSVVLARRDSPLLVGLGETFTVAASDIPALLPYTKKVAVLDDDEVALLQGGSFEVYGIDGKPKSCDLKEITFEATSPEKGGFADFMLKEIYEQPEAIAKTLMGRTEGSKILLDDVRIDLSELEAISKVSAVACGTSFHAALATKYSTESWARLAVEVDLSSEFRYREPVVDGATLVVAISQSGETADTLAALRHAKAQGAKVLSICNVVGSSMARESDAILYTRAGPEIGVAATKTFVSQVAAGSLLGLYLGQTRGKLRDDEASSVISEMRRIPELIEGSLKRWDKEASELAGELWKRRDFFFLGRGPGYPVALEGALKLKEISYVRAEGYAAGEMKHGPIALIEPGVVVFVIATTSKTQEKIVSNLEEVRARGATTVLMIDPDSSEFSPPADYVVEVPRVHELLSPIVNIVPLQLFAYHVAKRRGLDVDKPRNLAKTVTVE